MAVMKHISKKGVKNTSKTLSLSNPTRKYVKSGKYTKEEITRRKMESLLGQAEKLHKELGTNWQQTLENLRRNTKEVRREEEKPRNPTGKRTYIKSGKYTKYAILNRKKERISDRFEKVTKEAEENLKKEKGWYNNLKKSIMNLFSNEEEVKFVLEKSALNGVIKKYVIDLEKAGLSLYDPISLLEKVKPLVFEKFREFPSTKQQLSLNCEMEKKEIQLLEKFE